MVTPESKKLKSNDNKNAHQIVLPLAPRKKDSTSEMEIYARFMRHLRLVPHNRMTIKILSSIQFTADMLDLTDAFIAKTLVDMGLRAPRQAFPAAYLEFVDKSFLRKKWDLGAPNESLVELQKYWQGIGEDKFAAFQYDLQITHETTYVET